MALELKTPRDDITRGLGQRAKALAYGYNQAILVTTLRTATKIDSMVFDKFGLVLLGVDSKGSGLPKEPKYDICIHCIGMLGSWVDGQFTPCSHCNGTGKTMQV